MKTFITFFTALTFVTPCIAQPVITSENFTGPGTVLFLESANPTWFGEQSLIEQDGGEVLWNATNWEGLAPVERYFYPLDEVPGSYQLFFNSEFLYPEHVSTHAQSIGAEAMDAPLPVEISDGFSFFKNVESGYYATGTAFNLQGFPVVTRNDSIERIFKFPLTYGDIDSSAISFLTSVPLFGAYGQTGTRHTVVDAWGELATPYGLFNTIRVKAEIALTDTIYIEQTGTGQVIERPLETVYYWLSPNVPGPVLEMSVVEGNVTSAVMYTDDSTLSTDELPEVRQIRVYPNPATDYINFDLPADQPYSISIYDLSGKLVLQKNNVRGRIDVNALSPGVYVTEVSNRSGEDFIGKFTVVD